MKKNIVVLNVVFCVLILVALSSAQSLRWTYEYSWYGYDEAHAVVYSHDNIICAAGNSYDPETQNDIMVVGLDTLGNVLWGPVFYMTANIDYVNDMTCGNDNVFYVCGFCDELDYLPSPDQDYWVGAITSTGNPLWSYSYSPSGLREAFSIVQGRDNNIYSCGCFTVWDYPPIFVNPDFYVVSLTNSGSLRWAYKLDNGGNQYCIRDCALSIAYGDNNKIYAAGYISSAEGEQYEDFAVMKLDTSGAQEGIYLYNGPGNNTDEARSIICYGGELFIAGSSIGNGTGKDFTVVRLDLSLQEQWVYRYNGPANSNDGANKIIGGSDGNLYIAGYSGTDFTVISLDAAGNERWVYRKSGYGEANALAYGQDRIYVSGGSTVVCLDTSGNEIWTYPCSYTTNDIAYGLDGNIYNAGEGSFVVASLADTTELVSIKEKVFSSLQNRRLNLIVMTNRNTNLQFLISSPYEGGITLSIYNTIGQRVLLEKIDIPSGTSRHNIALPQSLACGVYFLRAEMAEESITKKFVLIE